MKALKFGPRFDADGINWICDDGSPADDEDVGFEASIDGDGCLRVVIGDKNEQHEWELTPDQAAELVQFLYQAQKARA